jgi:hypothetical protein
MSQSARQWGRQTNSEGGAMQLLSCIRGIECRYQSVSQSVCLSQRVLPVTQSKEGGGHAPMCI